MNKKRIVIDIPEELHTEIKNQASKRYMSIKRWVLQYLLYAIQRDHENQNANK